MKNCLLFIFVSGAVLSSCTSYRYIYTASPANNPYFSHKGQSKIAAYYSSNGEDNKKDKGNGYDLQGAYAISNRWAVIAGYYHRNEKQISTRGIQPVVSSLVTYKRDMFDVGTGYIIPFNERKTTTFNIYGGFGWGEFSFKDENAGDRYQRFHKSDIAKYYFQTSVNYMPDESINLSFLVKPSFVHYGNIRTDYSEEELARYGLSVLNKNTISFMEIGVNIQFGLKQYPWIKLEAMLATCSKPYYFTEGLAVHSGSLSIGLCFDFSKMVQLRK